MLDIIDQGREYLRSRYHPASTDLLSGNDKEKLLIDSLVPSDRLAISGSGAVIRTNQGDLIDFQAMTVNCILGQNDPWVKLQQIAYLISDRPSFHTTKLGSELYYSLPRRLADLRIGGICDPVISHRQCNGSDAMELAVKAASVRHKNKRGLVSFRGSYHGQNMTAYAISDVQSRHRFLTTTHQVTYFPGPTDVYAVDDPRALTSEEEAMLDQLDLMGQDIFAVVLEPIQMNNGVQPFSRAFLRTLREICTRQEICLIFDEVQTGLGWLGKLTAAEFHGVSPDAMAISKALTAGNGPLALTVATQDYRCMEYGTASKTNGADVRSLVAAHAVLDRLLGLPADAIPEFITGELRQELNCGLLSLLPSKFKIIDRLIAQLVERHSDLIGTPKGIGLIRGLDIRDATGNKSPDLAEKIVKYCFDNSLFVRTSGPSCLLIKIPGIIKENQLQRGFEILDDAFRNLKRNEKFRVKKRESMDKFNSIFSAALNALHSECGTFRYYKNQVLALNIAHEISNRTSELRGANTDIERILRDDFRKLDAHITSLQENNLRPKTPVGEIEYEQWRYQRVRTKKTSYFRFVSELELLFRSARSSEALVYLSDPSDYERIRAWGYACNGDFSGYIAAQLDLAGVNALVRRGLVKRLHLDNKTPVIIKKNNPDKEGRFLTEQRNLELLKHRLELPTRQANMEIRRDSRNRPVYLQLVRPIAVIRFQNEEGFCSIAHEEPHPTLEEVLLKERRSSVRLEHLENCRTLLNTLYERGIVWGDMAPRNILVEQRDNRTNYFILDFEKTFCSDGTITKAQRRTHARGPMCVEEFGAVCSLTELLSCFGEHFEPATWDTESASPLEADQKKKEVLSILEQRAHTPATVGAYNQIEKEIITIRLPYLDSLGQFRRPLYCSFKVDHYFGSEYDLKLTEVLIAASRYGVLENMQNWLEDLLENYENSLTVCDLDIGTCHHTSKYTAARLVKNWIDVLYSLRSDHSAFVRQVDNSQIRHEFYRNRTLGFSGCANDSDLAEANSIVVDRMLSKVVHVLPDEMLENCWLFVGGSLGRRHITFGSDVDIGLLCDDAATHSRFSEILSTKWRGKWDMPLEIYPYFDKQHLCDCLISDPELFFDLLALRFAHRPVNPVGRWERDLRAALQDVNVTKAANEFLHDDRLAFGLSRLKRLTYEIVYPVQNEGGHSLSAQATIGELILLKNEDEFRNSGFLPFMHDRPQATDKGKIE